MWHDVEPCYVFHPMNAFDDPDGDGIVLDVVRHPSMFRTHHLGPSEGAPTLERWHLDGHGGAVKEERLDDRGQEFPRVDERRVGLPHRFGYAVAVGHSDDILGTESVLLRHDFERGTSEARSFGRGAQPGRGGVRAPADGADEDEGWLLLLVHSARDRHAPPCTSSTPTISRARPRPSSTCPSGCRRVSTANWVPDPLLTRRPDQVSARTGAPGVLFRRVRLAMGPAAPDTVGDRLALVIVSCAGGTAWALVFRTVSSPVGLREALRIYRREQTGKMVASLRNRLPVPGVYTYRTSGRREPQLWSAWPAPSPRARP